MQRTSKTLIAIAQVCAGLACLKQAYYLLTYAHTILNCAVPSTISLRLPADRDTPPGMVLGRCGGVLVFFVTGTCFAGGEKNPTRLRGMSLSFSSFQAIKTLDLLSKKKNTIILVISAVMSPARLSLQRRGLEVKLVMAGCAASFSVGTSLACFALKCKRIVDVELW